MYDVIIAGGGPAGSSLAYFLARDGINTLLIEKELFPGRKPCGGVFPLKIQNFFHFSLDPAISRKLDSLVLRDRGKEVAVPLKENILCVTKREIFDPFLLTQAESNGANVIRGEKVRKITGTTVITDRNYYTGRIIVLADGAGSILKRNTPDKKRTWMKTVSGRIKGDFPPNGILDFTHVKTGEIGYFWIFPGSGWASVGFGCKADSRVNIKVILERYLMDYSLPVPDNLKFYNYAVFNGRFPSTPKNLIAIGDALDLPSPSTGGGIYQAIKSAFLAYITIVKSIDGKNNVLLKKLLMKEMFPSLYTDFILSKIFYNLPQKILLLKIGVPFFRITGRI